MKKVSRIFFTLLALLVLLGGGVQPQVKAAVRQPDTLIINGKVIYEKSSAKGTVVTDNTNNTNNNPNARVLMGYDYAPGYERLVNMQIVNKLKYIYGTTVSYVKGASPTYKLSVSKDTSASTSWNVSGSLSGEFNIKAVKAKLEGGGGYSSTDTATISAGQEWSCGFSIPGTYYLTWYMRGHKYDCQCGAYYISSDSNDGKFTYYNLGSATFATKEVTFEVTSK